ncbi:hypothetical protein [Brevundimonas sp. NPDC058933]|uniref:hypothetical protein n=1 Tax=Brevundimonas sp. NPDC058933 TaxID=3346673 RepID=UPI003BEEEC22
MEAGAPHVVIAGLTLAVMTIVFAVPGAIILRRLGFSRWWVILAMLPYVNIVGLWVLAFVRWPALDRSKT